MSVAPVLAADPVYQGLAISRPGLYDLQPALMYDPGDTQDANRNGVPDRLYKMAWLGQYKGGDADLAPNNLVVGDRIYMAFSENGVNWSTPQVVLKGSGGINGSITADDHLVGSPSMLKVNGTYFMFYEAYGTWATPIDRFYSFARGDNWVTGEADLPAQGNAEGYAFERNLGFASMFVKAGMHAIYSGEVTYHLSTGPKVNHFLSATAPAPGERDNATWAARNNGQPIFWLYDGPAAGRKAIYSYWDSAHQNTYVTDDPNGESVPGALRVELLGYAAESLDGPDMTGCDQNRVMMATSTDAVHWTRFQGPARGGAVVAPQNEHTTSFNARTWTLDRGYGSGYPSALVRDGQLELYFWDEDAQPGSDLRRLRMPVEQIMSPAAWTAARAAGNPSLTQFAGAGSDIKWSPLQRRYFVSYVKTDTPTLPGSDLNFRQSATVLWSEQDPDPAVPATFPAQNQVVLPTGGRVASWGGLMGDALGHTIDRTDGTPRTEFNAYFQSYQPGQHPEFGAELAHVAFTLLAQSPAVPAPEVSVDGVADGQAGAIDFGSVAQNSGGATKTFVIRNHGTAALTVGAVSLPAGYSLAKPSASSIAPGQSDTFIIRLNAAAAGVFTGAVSFATNDADENPYNFSITGRVISPAPEVDVVGVTDGQAAAVDFGSVVQNAVAPTKTFTVRNLGGSSLTLGAVSLPAGFTLMEPLSPTIAAGQEDTFTVWLNTAVPGTFAGILRFATNDSDENPYNFNVTGRIVTSAPEVDIAGIVSGQSAAIDFKSAAQNGAAPARTFTVRNLGTGTLTLGAVVLPAGFRLSEGLATSLAAGQSDTFTVALDTRATGAFSGSVCIATNDADENPYTFPVRGTVVGAPEIEVAGVADGQSTPVEFAPGAAGTTGPTRTFTVRNLGGATLILGKVSLPTGFTLAAAPPTSIAAGKSATFMVRLDTARAGIFSGQISIANNDSDENPFNFAVKGQVIDTSCRFGAVTGWQVSRSGGYLLVLKQVTVAGATGNTGRLYGDFYDANGSRIQWDVPVGNFQIFGNQITPRTTVLNNGNYVIAWCNTNQTTSGGVHYAIMTRYGAFSGSTDRIANVTYMPSAQLSGLASDSNTGGFTITWRNPANGKSLKRTFNSVGVATSGEVPA